MCLRLFGDAGLRWGLKCVLDRDGDIVGSRKDIQKNEP